MQRRILGARQISKALLFGFIIVAVIYSFSYWRLTRNENLGVASAQTVATNTPTVDFQVVRLIPSKRLGQSSKAIVSVDPQHFNDNDLILIAHRLNEIFVNENKIEVGLLDDEITARLFSEGKVNYATYEKAERGRYVLNRLNQKEYIEFSKERGGSKKRITIKISK